VLGTATLGHAFVVRFLLSSGAYDAARSCALANQPNTNCARAIVLRKLGTMAKWCNNNPNVEATPAPEVGFTDVHSLEVKVNCSYRGTVGTGFLKSHGIVIANLRARAVMPY